MNKMIHFGIPSDLPGLQNEKNEQNDSFRHAFYKKQTKWTKRFISTHLYLTLSLTLMQNNEISKQGYHFVGNDQFSGFFLWSRRSKMSQRVLLGFVVWGCEKLFWGVLTKNKNFLSTFFLRILCWFRILNKISKNMKVR